MCSLGLGENLGGLSEISMIEQIASMVVALFALTAITPDTLAQARRRYAPAAYFLGLQLS